jgi:hypothetical protein
LCSEGDTFFVVRSSAKWGPGANVPFVPQIVGLFTSDLLVSAAAVSDLRVVAATFPVSAVETTYEGALAGAGDMAPALLSGLLLHTARVPLAAALARSGSDSACTALGPWVAIDATAATQAAIKQLASSLSPSPRGTPRTGARTRRRGDSSSSRRSRSRRRSRRDVIVVGFG